jgi:hypothetical protein
MTFRLQEGGFANAHVVDTLRRIDRGESVGDFNRRLTPGFDGPGSMNVAFWLRDEGYMRDVYQGEKPIEPYVAQGGFQVGSWGVWRGELTDKGQALLELQA